MPALIAARLYRMVPLLVILAVIAVLVYVVAAWRFTPVKAREILIKVLMWISIVLCVFFALASVYALLEGNVFVCELFVTFLVTMLIILGIVALCKRSFLKHHPNYAWKTNAGFLTMGKRKG